MTLGTPSNGKELSPLVAGPNDIIVDSHFRPTLIPFYEPLRNDGSALRFRRSFSAGDSRKTLRPPITKRNQNFWEEEHRTKAGVLTPVNSTLWKRWRRETPRGFPEAVSCERSRFPKQLLLRTPIEPRSIKCELTAADRQLKRPKAGLYCRPRHNNVTERNNSAGLKG